VNFDFLSSYRLCKDLGDISIPRPKSETTENTTIKSRHPTASQQHSFLQFQSIYSNKMSSSSSSTSSSGFRKKTLEGIQINDALLQHWKKAFAMTTDRSSSPAADDVSRAMIELKNNGDPSTQDSDRPSKVMPLSVLQSIQVLYQRHDNYTDKLVSLEQALMSCSLAFTTTQPNDSTTSDARFQKRMERLRLKVEETKYSKLTGNLQDHRQQDDVTAKSMTFAASVGLNMIVAPLSFGCFMYFFAGGLFDFFLSGDEFEARKKPGGGTDIKRVIVGVISGVAMMIIEMLLFVIRTHELEEHNRRKKKKKGVEPFGVYSTNTPAIYSDGDAHKKKKTIQKDKSTTTTLEKKQK
jgi:Endoplasmic reticulum-based factor for assembly of V-ATPase